MEKLTRENGKAFQARFRAEQMRRAQEARFDYDNRELFDIVHRNHQMRSQVNEQKPVCEVIDVEPGSCTIKIRRNEYNEGNWYAVIAGCLSIVFGITAMGFM